MKHINTKPQTYSSLTSHSDIWRRLRWEASVFEPEGEVHQGGQSCQSLQGSKRLLKDISSLKVVMDGSVRPGSPQWLCVCACVHVGVCVHLHVSEEEGEEDSTKCSAVPLPLLSPSCLCFTLQTALCQISSL